MNRLLLILLLPLAAHATTQRELWDARCKAATLGGTVFIGLDTPSMLGTGLNGHPVVVVPQAAYVRGDIVTFRWFSRFATHRVVAVKPGFVYTKGDFCRVGDGWIPLADVVGRVVR